MLNRVFVKGLSTILILFAISVVTACANSARDTGGGGRRQGPPPEAIAACQEKQEGDVVSFTGRRGEEVKATCQTIDEQLVAVPEGHKAR